MSPHVDLARRSEQARCAVRNAAGANGLSDLDAAGAAGVSVSAFACAFGRVPRLPGALCDDRNDPPGQLLGARDPEFIRLQAQQSLDHRDNLVGAHTGGRMV
eukprot:1384514-Amphidinium_carterae.1